MVLLIILLILLDQVTKYFLTNIINYGAAFGILQNQTLFLIIVSLIVLGFCIYYFIKYKNKNQRIALSLIIAGTASNLIDRIFLGYVRDFINLQIWPVFNLADSYNVIGVGLLIYFIIKKNQ
ncbi:MAG: signal peptidase II [Nanoarchaeota archaeon]|nr:signal peptidase II [Nanoarchaeota archaeon]